MLSIGELDWNIHLSRPKTHENQHFRRAKACRNRIYGSCTTRRCRLPVRMLKFGRSRIDGRRPRFTNGTGVFLCWPSRNETGWPKNQNPTRSQQKFQKIRNRDLKYFPSHIRLSVDDKRLIINFRFTTHEMWNNVTAILINSSLLNESAALIGQRICKTGSDWTEAEILCKFSSAEAVADYRGAHSDKY